MVTSVHDFELRSDHKVVTKRIDQNIELLDSTRTLMQLSAYNLHSMQFALADERAEDSPTAEDGLRLEDQIVKFGNVESGDNLLPKLASEDQSNQGHGISVVVLRQAALVNLTVNT